MARVLFLEDEAVIRETLSDYLRAYDYDVIEAENGDAAKNYLDDSIDIAILDIMVPVISGIEVLKIIKKSFNGIPVIMLSALGDVETQLSAFDLDCDDYIVKPINPLLLLKRIQLILKRSKNLKCKKSGLYLDESGYTAYYKGDELHLTISEFLLLKLLFNNKNRAFTREQIILNVYNDEYMGSDRIIDTHVKNIRKKLPVDVIKTMIGIGYKYQE